MPSSSSYLVKFRWTLFWSFLLHVCPICIYCTVIIFYPRFVHFPFDLYDNIYYYIMILFKQFYWPSCCHLTFRKIWYCLIKTRIDLVSLSFSNEIYKKNLFHFNVIKQLVFCIGQYEFLWTLEINIHLSLKASVNIVLRSIKTCIDLNKRL